MFLLYTDTIIKKVASLMKHETYFVEHKRISKNRKACPTKYEIRLQLT